MYAHVNIWRLNEAGESSSTGAARMVAERLRDQPGFRSYALIRTGPREVVAVTVFETQAQLAAALPAVADVVDARVAPLAAGEPERREGEVAYYLAGEREAGA